MTDVDDGADIDASGRAVTVLMGDVEDSTSHWQLAPRAMAASIVALEKIVDTVVRRHRGERPVEQGEGDSFLAVFDSARDATECALALQQALDQHPWATPQPVRVRMGIHTGAVDMRTATRYGGRTFNKCARLRDLARGGHVVVSAVTAALLNDDLPEDVFLDDVGLQRLRGFERPEQVFAFRHGRAPATDVLRVPPSDVGNLPGTPTTFVGRTEALADLRARLDRSRLVTLVGPGGAGKTRLALELAREVRERYLDGAWWIDLAALNEPSLLAGEVLRQLGRGQPPGADAADALVIALRDRHQLVVVDNCEHLVEPVAVLAERVLAACPRLSVVATSREALAIGMESTYPVTPLAVPGSESETGEAVLATEAGRLFADRADAVRPGFTVDDDNATYIAAICRRLDGLPLAIELAAAQVAVLTPAEIAAALADRFRILTGGSRTSLPRQRTLEASVQWSHDLLDATEQTLFRRLAAFGGSFDLEAAEAVCVDGELAAEAVLPTLRALVAKSLVVAEPAGAQMRYRLLETMDAFARERLVESADADEVRHRHCSHYLGVAAAVEPLLLSPQVIEAMQRFDLEIVNMRAAIDWALSSGRANDALRLVGNLWLYWFSRDIGGEGLARAQEVLAAAPDADPALRFKALNGAAMSLLTTDMEPVARIAEEMVALADATGDPAMRCRALAWYGTAYAYTGRDGLPALEESLRLARELGEPSQLGRTLQWLGTVLLFQGERRRGNQMLEEAITLFRRTDNITQLGWALAWSGLGAAIGPNPALAVPTLTEALQVLSLLGQHGFASVIQGMLAFVTLRQGDHAVAGQLALDARARLRRAGVDTSSVAWILGLHALATGDLTAARTWLAEVAPDYRNTLMVPSIHLDWALLHLAEGDIAAARVSIAGCLEAVTALPALAAETHELWARIESAAGEIDAAETRARDAVRAARDAENAWGALQGLETLGLVRLEAGDPIAAARLLAAAAAGRRQLRLPALPVDEPRIADGLQRLRADLGETEFAEAWREGEALSLDDAAAYALRGSGPRQRSVAGIDSLTPAELEVSRLAAAGLSNPEIAARLFVSRNTVKVHLAHAYAKLQVTGRAALATELARAGITP